MNKTTIRVKGMHCRSCEMRIETELSKVRGVTKVSANHSRGAVVLYHTANRLNQKGIERRINEIGYEVGVETRPLFSKNPNDYVYLALSLAGLVELFYILKFSGLLSLGNTSSGEGFSSLPLVLMLGVTAGFSSCAALVGGLLLGVSARFAEKHPDASTVQRFKPHLFFNLGRIGSFILLGGMAGYMGSFLRLSPSMRGILMVGVAGVMLLLGLQLTEIMPRVSAISLTLPKGLGERLGIQSRRDNEYSSKGAAVMGALTFFLPCGFTQAMQLFAISSGSFSTGALTMGIFAIGTAPGLLSVGGLTSLVRGGFAKPFYKFVGLAVMALALFNASNGMSLAGLNITLPSFSTLALASAAGNATQLPELVPVENGVQIARMTQTSYSYEPNVFAIRKGVPVRWIINSEDAGSCASALVSSQLGVDTYLNQGENVIEFTPEQSGQIPFSCSMGMYVGVFYVVDDPGSQVSNSG